MLKRLQCLIQESKEPFPVLCSRFLWEGFLWNDVDYFVPMWLVSWVVIRMSLIPIFVLLVMFT